MSIFTQEISQQTFERALEDVGETLDMINQNWQLLCPHVKAIREEDGDIVDYESTARPMRGKTSVTRTFMVDNNKLTLKGNVYECEICGRKFFVPTENFKSRDELGRFHAFAQTYYNVLQMFTELTYAESTIRGLYKGDMPLDLSGKVRARIGENYLNDLAGKKVRTSSNFARNDRTLQLDRALLLVHLEVKKEVYRAILEYFEDGDTVVPDDVSPDAFDTAVDDDTYVPRRQEVREHSIRRQSSHRHLDMVSHEREEPKSKRKKKKTKSKGKSKKVEKDV